MSWQSGSCVWQGQPSGCCYPQRISNCVMTSVNTEHRKTSTDWCVYTSRDSRVAINGDLIEHCPVCEDLSDPGVHTKHTIMIL